MHRKALLILMLPLLLALQGCAALLVAGGATAVVAAKDRRTIGAMLDDQSIETKASAGFSADEALKGKIHVNVTSINGIVLLTGETPTQDQYSRVLAVVRGIPGVRRTVNEIRVAPVSSVTDRGRDAWITGKIRSELTALDNFDETQIKVVTENAVVYLMGLVTQAEADRAIEAATRVGGITRIVNLFEYIDDVIGGQDQY